MVILDTNVLSALMLREPDQTIISWLDLQAPTSVWTTSVTIFEIRYGLELMPVGRRRADLENIFGRLVQEKLESRVLVFDQPSADAGAIIMARRHQAGFPRELRDTLIAGIVLAHRATLATRNVRHFDDLDVPVIDPWQEA
jgi:predicted nucleic acid-binding protein